MIDCEAFPTYVTPKNHISGQAEAFHCDGETGGGISTVSFSQKIILKPYGEALYHSFFGLYVVLSRRFAS